MRDYIHFAQPLFEEEEKKEVLDALDSGWVTLGPKTKQFEEEFAKYTGAKHAIAVSSCTAALHIALIAAGIKQGDEVITTDLTFTASSNVILHTGATPVIVDIDPLTWNIDPKKIEEKITHNTKAIIPVHYGGQPCNMDEILRIAKKNNLKIVEDAAHAIGTEYSGKKIGTFGDFTCFSFHPIKNISTGDGGMITTNSDEYADMLNQLRLHGMSKDAWKRHSKIGSWKYNISVPGYKYNMTDISAALGIHQLKKLDKFIQTREHYAKIYDKEFSKTNEIKTPYVMDNIRHARNLYTIWLDTNNLTINRDEFVEELKKKQIGVSVYFIPLHHFDVYKKLGYKANDFPITEEVFKGIISLPMYPKMSLQDVQYVADTVNELVEKNRLPYKWNIDDFDSKILNMKVANISSLSTNGKRSDITPLIRKLTTELKKNKIKYATTRVNANNYPLIQELEKSGFITVDGLLSLSANVADINNGRISENIRQASKQDEKILKKIARNSFDRNRFFNDSKISEDKAKEIYAKWIENSLNNHQADSVMVYEDDSQVVGFITIKKDGHIPLVAVTKEHQGKGIGKKLLKAALRQLKNWKTKEAKIETQISNIAALRTYQDCGFKSSDSHLTLRWSE